MPTKKSKKAAESAVEEKNPPSQQKVLQAALNDPTLAEDEFKLGDRTFKVVDLEYDQFLAFTGYLEPLLKGVSAAVTARAGVQIPGINIESLDKKIDANFLMQICKNSLPEMAVLVCNAQVYASLEDGQEPDPAQLVDVRWIKKNARTPFRLAGIVMRQIEKNNLIGEFLDFFVKMLPMMMSLQKLGEKPPQE